VIVDLRSDTVTRPTPEMRRAMADAEVGDDVYGEDPTVNALEAAFAEQVGKPAALYVPSGTMANQLALRILTRPGDAVVCPARSHLVAYEDGAGARNAGVEFVPVDDTDGSVNPLAVQAAIAAVAHHQPRVGLVTLEDTHMASGGVPLAAGGVAAVARAAGTIPTHLDGARLWNAAVADKSAPADRAAGATTVSCCLSKGLCAPVGSLLAGPVDLMATARLERRRLGGGMRQAGVIAAAGLVALRSMVQRLADDHARAARLAEAVAERWPDCGLDPLSVRTNMVVFRHRDTAALLVHLDGRGVRAGTIAPGVVRLVTHGDVDDAGVEVARQAIAAAP
jgi:threonine aldolase